MQNRKEGSGAIENANNMLYTLLYKVVRFFVFRLRFRELLNPRSFRDCFRIYFISYMSWSGFKLFLYPIPFEY